MTTITISYDTSSNSDTGNAGWVASLETELEGARYTETISLDVRPVDEDEARAMVRDGSSRDIDVSDAEVTFDDSLAPEEPASYTYSIFDSNPAQGGDAWPTHEDIEIEAESAEDAVEQVRDILSTEAAGLNTSDGYSVGDTLYATVWGPDETIVGEPTYELTAEDLGVDGEHLTICAIC